MMWPLSWSCVNVGRTVRTKKQHNVGRVVSLVWVVRPRKKVGHIVGLGLFVDRVV